VADFGLSRTVGQAMTKKFSTEMFFAPELYTDEQYGHEVDVWALGVLLYHMISKVSPFCIFIYHYQHRRHKRSR
jgi:serine/threonine protein kinase